MPGAVRDTTTKTINVQILERRLDHARFLLTQTAIPLAAVAAGCGWRSEKGFAADFERRVGVAPAHYRQWHLSRFL